MDKAEWLAEIKKMRGIANYSVIGKFDDEAAASLLAKHFGLETPAPAFKPASPATGESAKAMATE